MRDGRPISIVGLQRASVGSATTPEAVRPSFGADGESGVDEQGVSEDEEVDEGAIRGPKRIRDIRTPTQEEAERHNLTHLPFRNWCPHCLRGRGKEAPHRRVMGGRENFRRSVWTFVSHRVKEELGL